MRQCLEGGHVLSSSSLSHFRIMLYATSTSPINDVVEGRCLWAVVQCIWGIPSLLSIPSMVVQAALSWILPMAQNPYHFSYPSVSASSDRP